MYLYGRYGEGEWSDREVQKIQADRAPSLFALYLFSIYLSIYLSIYQSIYLSIYLSINQSMYLSLTFLFSLFFVSLLSAPGKQFSMETAPWKLTEEMVDVSYILWVLYLLWSHFLSFSSFHFLNPLTTSHYLLLFLIFHSFFNFFFIIALFSCTNFSVLRSTFPS